MRKRRKKKEEQRRRDKKEHIHACLCLCVPVVRVGAPLGMRGLSLALVVDAVKAAKVKRQIVKQSANQRKEEK